MHSTTQRLVNLTDTYHTLDRLTQSDEAFNSYSPALFGTFQQVLYSQTTLQLEVLQASITSKQNTCLDRLPKNTAYTHKTLKMCGYLNILKICHRLPLKQYKKKPLFEFISTVFLTSSPCIHRSQWKQKSKK